MTYATRIAAWLAHKHLTLDEGALIIGCSTAALCRWRANETQPQGMYRVALEKALERFENANANVATPEA